MIVLGAGVSGLAVGMASGAPVFEAAAGPGGLCSSYYVRPGGAERLARPPTDAEAYRFEVGGGHWIFGGDPEVLARLDALVHAMADACDVRYGHRAVAIDPVAREVGFDDGSSAGYTELVSTLPLVDMVRLAGLTVEGEPDPHTSVLVLNIGAERGPCHPDQHWIYQPHSASGHHRIGFCSNVDESFLPSSARRAHDRSAVYVERAYRGGDVPTAAEQSVFTDAVVAELQSSGYLGAVDVVDPTWIDVAYTWSWPRSTWRARALDALAAHGIHQVGRFARWSFQGIADSVKEGLQAGTARRAA